jgi:hypothetical protein
VHVGKKRARDHHVDHGPRNRDEQFFFRGVGHFFHSCHAADREKCDVASFDSETACSQRVAKFMQDDAGKERQNVSERQHQLIGAARLLVIGKADVEK